MIFHHSVDTPTPNSPHQLSVTIHPAVLPAQRAVALQLNDDRQVLTFGAKRAHAYAS